MKRRLGILLGLLVAAGSAHAVLIASESFKTSGSTDDYNNGNSVATDAKYTVVGNSGFTTNRPWLGAVGSVTPKDWTSFAHSGLPGTTETGFIGIWKGQQTQDEYSIRQMGSTPVPVSTKYYFSGLLRALNITGMVDGEYRSAGIGDAPVPALPEPGDPASIAKGFHYGVRKEAGTVYLSIFAGDQSYDLQIITAADASVKYQVVLELEVDVSGTETLTAWYAADGAPGQNKALVTSVETWSSASDLEWLRLQRKATAEEGAAGDIMFDEMYFGTTYEDVTTLPVALTLLASESWQVTTSADDYGHDATFENSVVTNGNYGFVSSQRWWNQSAGLNTYSNSAASLNHSALTGTAIDGGVQMFGEGASDTGRSRRLGSTPASSSSYYLSGLVKGTGYDGTPNNDQWFCSMGFHEQYFGGSTVDIAKGFHYGFSKAGGVVSLSVFAGGNTYNLLTIDAANASTTYQVVLRLDVSAAGTETLTAWYAADGDTELILGLPATAVETWAAAGDLFHMRVQHKVGMQSGAVMGFDETRFGRRFDDVTTLSEPVSGPTTYAAFIDTFGITGEPLTGTEEDYDSDGLLNIYEYGFGGDPTDPLDVGTLPVLTYGAGDTVSYKNVVLSNPDTDIVYIVEQTEDLVVGPWTDSGWSGVSTNNTADPLYDEVDRTIDGSGKDNLFMRLRIIQL